MINIIRCSFLLLFFLMPLSAHAACTNPTGSEGDLVYHQGLRLVQYCNGTNWKAAMKAGAPRTGDCTSPTRKEGKIIYNQDDNVPQVCIGGWRALGPANPSAGTGGCSSPTRVEGTIIYNDDLNVMQYCDGSQYVELLGPAPEDCPDIGDICVDGSIYAGLSPAGDGTSRMYVTRCDVGMSFDGSSCQGTRTMTEWNNNNTTGFVSIGDNSDTDGKTNTSLIIVTDSDSVTAGKQPHRAAQYCADLAAHGRTDWYLPASDELDLIIYENLIDGTPNDNSPDPLHDGFEASFYWTSTEQSSQRASRLTASNGNLGSDDKDDVNAVRCARR